MKTTNLTKPSGRIITVDVATRAIVGELVLQLWFLCKGDWVAVVEFHGAEGFCCNFLVSRICYVIIYNICALFCAQVVVVIPKYVTVTVKPITVHVQIRYEERKFLICAIVVCTYIV